MQIAIVLYPGFTALDFIGPYEVLRWLPDAEVRFVWHEPGPVTADSGVLVVAATHSFDETPSPDVILVPGGFSTMEHARDERLLDWVRKAHETATWTASVCSGSIILAAAGLLEGKRATSHWAALTALKALGVKPVGDERIVHEGEIVTCAGVSAGIDLGLWLAGQIGGESRAKVIQLSMEYDPQPPFDSGHMSKASASTKAAAAALMSKDLVTNGQLKPMTQLVWARAIKAARERRAQSRVRRRERVGRALAADRAGQPFDRLGRSGVGDTRRTERRHGVFMMDQRSRGRREHLELVDDGLPFWLVPPDADALMRGGLPGGFVDDDRVPADLPLEPDGVMRVVGQFFVVGVLPDRKGHVETQLLDALIGRHHVVEGGGLDVARAVRGCESG